MRTLFKSLSLLLLGSLAGSALTAQTTATGPGYLDSWNWQAPTPADAANLIGIAANGSTVLAVGEDGQVQRSTDGGDSWTIVSDPLFVGTTFSGIANSGATFVIVGSGGSALRSSDNGLTWTTVDADTTEDLLDLAFDGLSATWIAVGASGTIRRSVDGGLTWSSVANPSTRDLRAVAAFGGNFYAGGEAGTLIRFAPGAASASILQGGSGGFTYDIRDFTVGNGIILAVGTNGHILRSINGTNWSVVFSNSAYDLYTVAYHPMGFFLAAGEDGRYVYSLNAVNWTEGTNRTPFAANRLIPRVDDFLAVGSQFTVAAASPIIVADSLLSMVGIGWTLVSGRDTHSFRGAAYGEGAFVVVGESGEIRFSSDASTWSEPINTVPGANSWLAVTFGNGRFVAVGDNGAVAYAEAADLDNWSSGVVTGGPFDFSGIAFGNNRFVATARNSSVLVSDDGGETWNAVLAGTVSSNELAGVAFGNERFVAVGSGGTIFTSDNAFTWTPRFTPTDADLTGIIYGPQGFVAVGAGGTVLTSEFGASWTRQSSGTELDLEAVAYADGVYLATGAGRSILTSLDGRDWALQDALTENRFFAAAAGNGLFVVAGEFGSILSSSSPLSSGLDRWTLRNPAALSDDLSDVLFANGLYVVAGANGRLLTSVDGESWTPRNSGTTQNITGIAYGNDRWVAVAGQDILVSTDGATWSVTSTWTVPMFRVKFGAGRFVAVGDSSTIISSVDGLVWSGGVWHEFADRAPMRGVTYSPDLGVWIAVGDNLPDIRTIFLDDEDENGDDDEPSFAAGRPVQLYVSFNGGASFQFLGLDLLLQGINQGNSDLSLRAVAVDTVNFATPRLVVAGSSNLVSDDGLNWSIAGGSPYALDAAFGDANGFPNLVIVGEGGAISSFSTQELSFPGISENINAITYANDRFIAVGNGGRILTSPEGRFWQIRGVEEQPALRSIARGAGAYVAVGENGQIFRSLSGVSWTPQSPPPEAGSPTMLDVIWTGSLFLAVGDVGNLWTSTGGANWEQRLSGVVSRLNAAASNGTTTIVVGDQGRILRSSFGVNDWIPQPSGTGGALLAALWDAANNQFIVAGANGRILTSPNGQVWTPAISSPLDSLPIRDIAQASDGTLLAVGDEGRIFTSQNGQNWTPVSSGTRETLRTITYGDGLFLALGDNGVALSSSNLGASWYSRPTNTAYTLYGSSYFEGVFVSVGGFGTIIHSGVIFDKAPQSILFPTIAERTLADSPVLLQGVASSGLPVTFQVVSGPAQVSGNVLTLTGLGTVTVRARQDGNRFFLAAQPVAQSFSVVEAVRSPQEIIFDSIDDQSFGVSIDLQEFVRSSSGLPVTFELISGPASLVESFLTTGSAPGLVRVRALQGGNAQFAPASPQVREFQVRDKLKQEISILPFPPPMLGDPAITLRATSSSGLDNFTFRVISGPAHVSGDQMAVYGVGVVTLEARERGNSEFDAAMTRLTFSVGGTDNFEPGPGFLDLWTWRSPALNEAEAYKGLANSNNWIVAVGDNGRIARRALSGGAWLPVDSGTTADLTDVIFDPAGERFIAVGDEGTLLISITEGTGWDEFTLPGSPDLRGVAVNADGSRFVAVATDGRVLTSGDGLNWTDASPAGFTAGLNAVIWAPRIATGRFVAVGQTGAILRSTDSTGTSFEVIREGLGFNLHAVHAPAENFGDWRLFTVGDNGIVLGSKDGVVWSNRFSGSAYSLRSVHSGNGFLLAAGDDGRVLYSRNGDGWTESFTRFNVTIHTLSFNDGLFLAGGANYSIFTSPQGLTWTIQETTDRTTLRASAANSAGNIRVAVGDNGRILRSVDGVDWAPAAAVPISADFYGVTFGNASFVAVGTEGAILTSSDGDTWTTSVSGITRRLNDVAFANGRFIAVGNDFTTLTSTDGLVWTPVTSGSSNALHAVAFGNGIWTAVGDNGVIVTSFDGVSWQTQFSDTTRNLRGLMFGNDQFVAVGQGGAIFTSPFGNVWTQRASGTNFDLESVALADGVYVAVGAGFTFLTSRNGVDWSAQKSGTLNSLRHVSFAAGLFVAVGDFGTILTATSILPLGLDRWTLRNPLPSGPDLQEVIYADGIYMAVGDEGTILVSTDGLNWTTRNPGIDDPITGVAYGNGRFVAVGGQNILVSENTIDWTVQTTWLVPLYTVTFGANVFVAVGAESNILYSSDGLIWGGGPQSAQGQDLLDVAYDSRGGRFVAVGVAAPMQVFVQWEDPETLFSFTRTVTQIYVSGNGIDWERKEPPLRVRPTRVITVANAGLILDPPPVWHNETLRTISFGRDYILAAGDGLIISSSTGETGDWEVRSAGGRSILGSAFGEGQGRERFVHVGLGGAISSFDPDSVSFPGISENLNSIVWGKDQFVAVGDNSRILTSPTGQFWQVRSTEVLPAFRALASRPGEYIAVGDSGLIYRSTDAITWLPSASPTVLDLRDVIVSGSRYIAAGRGGVILTSGNGTTWTLRVSGVLEDLHSVARSTTGAVIVVGENGRILRSSDEGIDNWILIPSGITDRLSSVAYNATLGAFFAVGSNGRLLVSEDDGFSWTVSTIPAFGVLPLNVLHVNSDGSMVAAGELGRIFTSVDGVAWSPQFSGTTNAIHSISAHDDFLLATGAAGTALSSSDGGVSWFRRHTNTGYTLYGSTFRDGAFIAVGGFSTVITSGSVESKFDQSIQFVPIPPRVITDAPFAIFAQSTSGLPVEFSIVSGPATVDGNIITLTGVAGDVLVRASQPGNANFRPAVAVDQTFRVTLANQVITFDLLPDRVFGDPPFELVATTTAPGLSVQFTVESGPAILDGNRLRLTAPGFVTVVASQPGTEQFNQAPSVSRTFEVTRASQTITFDPPASVTLGDPPLELVAESSSDLPVSFSLISGPASLVDGRLVFESGGTVVVEATQGGDAFFLPAEPVRRTLSVEPAMPGNFWRAATVPALAQSSDFRDIIWSGEDEMFVAVGTEQTVITSINSLNWSRRSSIGPIELTAVTRGFDGYLASGATGMRLRSANGLNWSTLSDALAAQISSMAYGNGLYVAVGANGFIATSPTGRRNADWQVRTSDATELLTSVAFLEGEFFAAGDGILLRSVDGREWETLFFSPADQFRAISRSGSNLVVVGQSGAVWYSLDDGENWFLGLGVNGDLFDVTFGAGRFVAVGEAGRIFTSPTGEVWTPRVSTVTNDLHGVVFTEDVFVVVGDNGTVLTTGDPLENVLPKDPQAITFDPLSDMVFSSGSRVLSATSDSGLPVTFGVASGNARLESDGVTLTFTGLGEVVVRAAQLGDAQFAPAQEAERRFTIIGIQQTINFPEIGAKRQGDPPFLPEAEALPSGLPVTFEIVSGPAIIRNGLIELTGGGAVVVRALQGGDELHLPAEPVEQTFLVRLSDAPQVVTILPFDPPSLGDPAISLEAVASSGLTEFTFRVISGPAFADGNRLAVYGVGVVTLEARQPGDAEYLPAVDRISFSVGGTDNFEPGPGFQDLWTWRSPEESDDRYLGLARNADWAVAVGDSGRIARSSDGGVSWESVPSGISASLHDVIYDAAGARFIAVGDAGYLLVSSPDGGAWTESVLPGSPNLRGIASNGDGTRFVVVAEGGRVWESDDTSIWTEVTPSGFSRDLASVVWAPQLGTAGRFVAVGATGAILRSTDETGGSFEVIREGLGYALYSIHAPEYAFGDWKLFAVGENGIVLASKDGAVWSNRFSGSDYRLRAVHSGNGFIIAAGDGGRVLYSQNGDNWTETFTRFDVTIHTLSFTNGLFIGGGNNFSIFTSPQGLTWTIRETTDRVTLRGSAASPGGAVRVAVGDSGRILRSLDGFSWSPAASVPSSEDLYGVAYGSSGFVAVGSSGTILASPDGDTWTALSSGTTRTLKDVAFANGQFIAVGDGFTTLRSTDGVSWSPVTGGSLNGLHSVSYGNGVWVAVGADGLVVTSTNGSSWRTEFSGTTRSLNEVTFGNGQFVAVGERGAIYTSPFGNVWTLRASGTTFDLEGVALADGVYVAVGAGFTFLTSRDGIDWSAQKSGTLNSLRSVSYAADLFVAVGDFGTILTATSVLPPGLDQWTLRNPLPSGPALREVIYANGIYMAVGDEGTILVSTDGLNWSTRDPGIDEPITGVAYGNGRFVAVGGQNILVSEDTVEWTVQTTWLVPLHTVTFGANVFVAVGAESHILYSADGIIWAGGSRNIDGQDLFDVRYDHSIGRFVAVGAPALMDAVYIWPDPEIVFVYENEPLAQIYVSNNGINWQRKQPPLRIIPTRLVATPLGLIPDPLPKWYENTLRTVTSGRGYFLAAGDGLMISSFTGETDEWDVVSVGGRTISGSAFGEGQGRERFVHVGVNGSISSHAPESLSFPGISEDLHSVVWGENQFVAVGDASRILTSPTGQFWQVRSTEVLPAFRAVTSRPGQYVAVGESGMIYRSSDAISWEVASTPSNLNLNDVIVSGSRYVAIGDGGVILTAPNDAVSWTLRVSGVLESLNAVARNPDGALVAVGDNGSVVRATDGTIDSWVQIPLGLDGDHLTAVAFNEALGKFYAIGTNGRLLESDDDGLTWTLRTVPEFGVLPIYALHVNRDGGMVAAGELGRVFTSVDGDTWIPRFSGTTNALHSLVFGDNLLLATGASGTAITSSDGGVSWFRRHTNTGYTLFGSNYRDGAFVSVGGFSTIITSGAIETKFDQLLQLAPIPPKIVTDAPFPVFAQSTSGLPVEFSIVSGPATINGNVITLAGEVGDVVVRASQPGNANFRPAQSVEQTFRVTLANQVITFAPLPNRTFGDPPFALEATTTAAGLEVVFTVESGPAELDGNLLRINGTGEVTVVASQPGTPQFNPAPSVSRTFVVGPATQSIVFELPANGTLGDPPLDLIAESTSGLPVSFRVVSGPGSVSGGRLSLDGVGRIVVEATQSGSQLYQPAAPVLSEINVTPALPGNFWSSVSLPPSVAATDFRDVIWSGQDGRFVAVGSGQAVITSSTGLNWSRRSSNGSAELTSVSRGFDGFLASSATGMRLRSPDGLSWAALSNALVAPVSDMVYGNGLFVAVGAGGFIATAPSGRQAADWTVRSSDAEGLLTSVIYSNGEFLAAGDGVLLRSSDGREWETVFSSPGDLFRDITRNGDHLVVVGETGVVWYSPDDGESWFLGVGASGNLTAVTYGAGRFVAVGESGIIFTSPDGLEWTPRVSNVTANLRAVAFTERTFVVVGDNGTVLTTGDPQTNVLAKEAQEISFSTIPDVSLNSGEVVLSATSTSGLPVRFGVSSGPAVLEADGVTLTLTGLGEVVVRASQSGDATFAPAAEVERRFTVTGIEQTINFATIPSKVFGDPPFQPVATVLPSGLPAQFEIVSGPAVIRDGLIEITGVGTVVVRAKQPGDATHMAAPAVEQSFVVARAPQVITFGVLSPMEEVDPPRTLVATSSSGLPVSFEIVSGPATISDGNRLTPTGVGQVTVRATQPGNQLYLPAAPRERTFEVRPSSTGSVWTPVPDRPVETDLVGVSFAGFRFFATGARSAILRANSDASDWTAVSTGSGVLNKVAFGNNVYVAVGEAGIVLQSPSGTSWNFFSSGVDVPMNDIVYGKGRFVAVGSGGAIFTSTSGTDWTFVQSGVSDDLRSVIYGGGRFVAVGGRGITVSMDGLNWTALETAEAAGFNAITYGGGRYLIVGDDFTVWTSSNTNSWTIGSQTGPDLFGVAYGGGRFIAVGSEGAIFTSASGLGGWLQRSSGTTANLRDVAYIEDKFVIVGDGGTILHDGVINIRSPQTITFGEIPDRGLMEGLLTLSPSASSGLPVTLTVISGPATFMVDGRTLIFASGGMVTVRASQEGNGDFLPAPEVTRTFSVRGPSDPTDFALLSNRDLLLGELAGNDLEAAAVIIENTGRAAYIDSRMRSPEFLSVRRGLMVNAFMRGTWGGPQSMERNKEIIDTFGLAFLIESLIPDFRRVYFENRAVPGIMAPASEVDPFLRAVWRAKYGAEAPEPTSAQLAPLREGFRSFPVEMFLAQVIQEVSGFDGRSVIFGIPNPPPNRLRDEADAAALIIGLMRLPASNAEVARLARQPLLAQIEQVLADERYFDRLALWAGSAEFSDDIRFSPWLGVHWVTGDGWTYSPELGWIYIFADDMMGLWIYSVDLGWMWTSPGYYSAGLYYRVNGGWSSR